MIRWNEPSRAVSRSHFGMKGYIAYLKNKYGSVEAYNRIAFRQYRDFADLLESAPEAGEYFLPFQSFNEQVEWSLYSVENLMGHCG